MFVLEEQLAGLCLGMFVYDQKRPIDFLFQRVLSVVFHSLCITGCMTVTVGRGKSGTWSGMEEWQSWRRQYVAMGWGIPRAGLEELKLLLPL